MAKSRDAFRTISEVAEWLETPAHVLRFWESKFTQVKPVKRAGGRRYYRPADMELLGGIKKLLHDDGMTIKGVQKVLREQGVRHVASLATQPVDETASELIEDAPYAEVPLDEHPEAVVAFPGEIKARPAPSPEETAEPAEAANPDHGPQDEIVKAKESAPEDKHPAAEAVPVETSEADPEPEQAEAPDQEPGAPDEEPLPLDAADDEPDGVVPLPEDEESPESTISEAAPPHDREDVETAPSEYAEETAMEPVTVTDSPVLDGWNVSETPELPFEILPSHSAPPVDNPVTTEAEPSQTPEDAPSPKSRPLDLPDFAAPKAPDTPPAPKVGPLGHIARINTLTPAQKTALAAHLSALEALRDKLSRPLS